MNTLLLLWGLRPWKAASSTSRLTRVFVAVSVFSVEAQIVTLLGIGSIRSLVLVNIAAAAVTFAFWRPTTDPHGRVAVAPLGVVPLAAVALLGGLVLALNLSRPFEAADPYHLDKIDRIERMGTLAYDPATETKINILNSTYELLLADLRGVPLVGPWLVRLHGVLGLALYLLALAAVRESLAGGNGRWAAKLEPSGGAELRPWRTGSWPWAIMLAVPVVFHQLVLVKNDLFVGVIGLVVLAWTIARSDTATWREIVWASWLAGLAVSVKLTSLPLLVMVAGTLVLRRRDRWPSIAGVAVGALAGVVAGGLVFTLIQNVKVYGVLMPVEDLGNRPGGIEEVLVDIPRFVISLFDLGLLTRRWWPGRGGWGGTFGLPFVWAVVVLAISSRRSSEARVALLCAGAYFLTFATAFPDADIAQRLALGPGLLLVAVAVHMLDHGTPLSNPLRLALWPVVVLSGAQIARSAFLYLQ